MGDSNVKDSKPKGRGHGSRACRACGNTHGLIHKYGLDCCRQCFHAHADKIGFEKTR